MSEPKLIEGWGVGTNTDNGYLAPELRYVNITGGEIVGRGPIRHTGWIVAILPDGSIRTLSGSHYRLGTPAVDGARDKLLLAFAKLGPTGTMGYHPVTLAHIRGES